jgi:hypothetical protein
MNRHPVRDVASRRSFLRSTAILCSLRCVAAQPRFWNTKDPNEYSVDETREILTNSPWAKTTRAEAPGANPQAAGVLLQPCPTAPATCASRQPQVVDPRSHSGNTKDALAFYGRVTVRWESAKLILQVTHRPLPTEFASHYVIGIAGLPANVVSRGPNTPPPAAVLSVGSHPPQQAEFVALTSDNQTLLFAFPKPTPAIQASDKSVSFAMNLSGIRIKVGFVPREMIYRGELAL